MITFKMKGCILRDAAGAHGYRVVVFSDVLNGRRPASQRVHRAIATAFHDNPDNKPEVAHGNGINNDNRAANLRWATRSENMDDVRKHGKRRIQTRSG